jgi:hypothetical protein
MELFNLFWLEPVIVLEEAESIGVSAKSAAKLGGVFE